MTTAFDKLEGVILERGDLPDSYVKITTELARALLRDYRDLLAERNAGEFDLFETIPHTEARSDIRKAFARQVSGEAKKPQEFWGR